MIAQRTLNGSAQNVEQASFLCQGISLNQMQLDYVGSALHNNWLQNE